MNAKTKSFIDEILHLLQQHGVSITDADQYDGEERFSGTNYYFEGKGIRLGIDDLKQALEKSKADSRVPVSMTVWRENKAGRQYIVALSKEEVLWGNKRENAKAFSFTVPQYARLITRLEKTDRRHAYVFGHTKIEPRIGIASMMPKPMKPGIKSNFKSTIGPGITQAIMAERRSLKKG